MFHTVYSKWILQGWFRKKTKTFLFIFFIIVVATVAAFKIQHTNHIHQSVNFLCDWYVNPRTPTTGNCCLIILINYSKCPRQNRSENLSLPSAFSVSPRTMYWAPIIGLKGSTNKVWTTTWCSFDACWADSVALDSSGW